MKKMRLPLCIALGLFIVALIIGSIWDLQISQSIADPSNGFALTIAAISPTIVLIPLGFIGGGFLAFGFQDRPVQVKTVCFIAAAIVYIACIVLCGGEYFGENGFELTDIVWLGYLIAAVFFAIVAGIGCYVFRNNQDPNAWIVLLVMTGVIFVVLLASITGLKLIFHRPRYRSVVIYDALEFHPWWKRCGNYKQLMIDLDLTKEEFKSFPSGHTGDSCVLMVAATFLPLFSKKAQKYQIPLFCAGFVVAAFVAFTRILAGAHFLSDTAFAGILMMIFTIIGNEILIRVKRFQLQAKEE